MKKVYLFLFFTFSIVCFSYGQQKPIKWTTKVRKISETEYDIIFNVNLDKGWKLYSQNNPEGGSLPLQIRKTDQNHRFQLKGKAVESQVYKEYSDVWGQEEIFIKDKGVLIQKISVLDKDITRVKLNVFGQICKKGCIQINQNFDISL